MRLADGSGGATPLDPSGDQARRWLERELLDPAYHRDDLVRRVLDWIGRLFESGQRRAVDTPPLGYAAAMVLLVALALGLVWLVSRTRRSRRAARPRASVLGERLDARTLRERADRALAEGRLEDALLDSFRALAVRQVEQGRLEDLPQATAREVASALALALPAAGERLHALARLFEDVLYGDRPAAREQVVEVQALDDELGGVRR